MMGLECPTAHLLCPIITGSRTSNTVPPLAMVTEGSSVRSVEIVKQRVGKNLKTRHDVP